MTIEFTTDKTLSRPGGGKHNIHVQWILHGTINGWRILLSMLCFDCLNFSVKLNRSVMSIADWLDFVVLRRYTKTLYYHLWLSFEKMLVMQLDDHGIKVGSSGMAFTNIESEHWETALHTEVVKHHIQQSTCVVPLGYNSEDNSSNAEYVMVDRSYSYSPCLDLYIYFHDTLNSLWKMGYHLVIQKVSVRPG